MSIPNHSQTELDNQIGAVLVGLGDVILVIGCSSSGTAAVPKAYAPNQVAQLVADFGHGPGVQMAALIIAKGKSVVFCKVATATAGSAGDVTVVNPGTATTPTATGANDTRHIKLRWSTGCTLGTAGGVYQYSLDGGITWSQPQRLGTSLTIAPANTGTTITLGTAAQTILATTTHEVRTFEPEFDATTLAAAWAGIKVSAVPWDFFQVVGAASKATFDAVKSELDSVMATLSKKTGGFLEARRQDYEADETEAEWMESIVADYETADSKRLVVGAGELLIFSPVDKSTYLRPVTWAAMVRAALIDTARYELGRVKNDGNGGPLDAALFDSSGNPVGHNEERTPGLDTTGVGGIARFMTARTHPTKGKAAYITRTPIMTAAGSDFDSWQRRRAMDIACNATRRILVDEIQETPVLNPGNGTEPPKVGGAVTNGYALQLEASCDRVLRELLVKPGRCSPRGGAKGDKPGAYVVVDRGEVTRTTKKIKVLTRMAPLGRIDFIEEEVAYENPALFAAVGS